MEEFEKGKIKKPKITLVSKSGFYCSLEVTVFNIFFLHTMKNIFYTTGSNFPLFTSLLVITVKRLFTKVSLLWSSVKSNAQ